MRVQKVQGRAFGARVDGATPRGLWPPDGGGLCRRVVKGKVLKMDGPREPLCGPGSEGSEGS